MLRRVLSAVKLRNVLALTLCLCAAGAAAQNVTFCNSPTTITGTFGSIVVPAGGFCQLINSTVNGSISVSAGAWLSIAGGVTVKGSIAAYKSAMVQVYHGAGFATNVIHGSVGIVGTTGIPSNPYQSVAFCGAVIGGSVVISGTQGNGVAFGGSGPDAKCNINGGGNAVDGDVAIQGSSVTLFHVADNYVRRSLLITGNKGNGAKNILNNQARVSIVCSANDQPLNTGGNSAPLRLGQCKP